MSDDFHPKSPLLQILKERGFYNQCTDAAALDELALKGPIACYVGYDCTADSLHVGSLLSIMMMRWLQKTGHQPIILMGGGTTRVGDPSGKDEQRKMLNDEKIAANMAGIRKIFEQLITFGDGPTDAVMVNNADWLDSLNYIDFLRDYGPHFTINRMLTFDSVRLRLDREQPLTFLEFNYMLLQAFDFLELSRRHNCRMQIGGSDQWGNIINGVELARRVDGVQVFGLTTNLLTTSSGKKMGKSAEGAVWLNEGRLSHFDFYQYWRNTEDADVGKFLALFTELPMQEVRRLGALQGSELNQAKKILAFEVTQLCRGKLAAEQASAAAQKTFENGGVGASSLPSVDVSQKDWDVGLSLISALGLVGFSKSNGEARRLIRGGGVRINNVVCQDESYVLKSNDLDEGRTVQLSAGKKRHVLLRLTNE